MTVPLRSARLTLRAHTDDDAAAVRALYSQPLVCRYLGDGAVHVHSLADALAKIEGWRREYGEHPVQGVWAICAPSGVVGTVLLKPLPESGTGARREIEVGWHLDPAAWGRGFATEAARAVLEHGFAHGLHRVLAVTHPENVASQRVCARLGMRSRGVTAAYYDAACALFERTAPSVPPAERDADERSVAKSTNREGTDA